LSVGYSSFIIQKKFCDQFEPDIIDKGLNHVGDAFGTQVPIFCHKQGASQYIKKILRERK
jgi:hypothetical protein